MSDPPAYRHPPYQGGQGGSNLKSIFNLIITSYLSYSLVGRNWGTFLPEMSPLPRIGYKDEFTL
ncbi:unknown protein [Microcystis aeruginosa NIES-843]|uniref:Uncharacterized protein n=1 Tax=Microcystis aeruginosa (strain NIES-843 / IAM M-2473) TaxID=449447 RepID=B0JS58_MICAN|nr:unknown protein [Microcystis aeruginosa NIES-843]